MNGYEWTYVCNSHCDMNHLCDNGLVVVLDPRAVNFAPDCLAELRVQSPRLGFIPDVAEEVLDNGFNGGFTM